ncbi:MAG: BLUF domain-containing protein [Rhodobacteraceae bacterium]|nr:BLUF domain-containing protein [Paracoccaceae bacterium]
MDLKFLLYFSHALIDDDPHEHNKILQACHKRNVPIGLTGFLHREGDFFVQYLEGPEDQLNNAMQRISKDPRHTDVQVAIEGPLEARQLPDWQMGFVNGEQLSLIDVVGMRDGKLDIKSADPWDLVEFVLENADALSEQALVA